jgi:hypothetical protein
MKTNFREILRGEVHGDSSSSPSPRSEGPTLGGAIIQPEGIIRVLCKPGINLSCT